MFNLILLLSLVAPTVLADLTGYIYADNYFEFWHNGQLIATDPVDFIPHNAVAINIQEDKEPACRTFAIFAKDYADDTTGLEYNNTCVGDGGLRAVFSDGTVTNSAWRYSTIHYGPDNLYECLPGVDLASGHNCRKEGMVDPCQCMSYQPPEGWQEEGFDSVGWSYVTIFTDEEVGWGIPPTPGDGLLDPRDVDWKNSTFVWGPSLYLDNRILFLHSYCK